MSVYCNSPWTSIFLEPNGDVRSCCAGKWKYGNINDATIEEILTNPKIAELKQEILDGKIPDYCSVCEYTEKKTGRSQRNYFTNFELADTDITKFDLQSLDIRWSNLCNLACNYCDYKYSSEWQKFNKIPIGTTKNSNHDSLLKYIVDNKNKISRIILAGGEPLLQKQNIDLLETLDDSVTIELITNLSFKLEGTKVYELLKQRSKVSWALSFDNTNDMYDYTRHKASWSQFFENLKLLKRDAPKKHEIRFFPVFCIYSIDTIKEYMQLAREHTGRTFVNWQPLADPNQLNIFNFSKPVREYAKAKIKELLDIENFTFIGHERTFFEQAYDNLNNDPAKEYDLQFRQWTENQEATHRIDGLSFAKIWPELDSLIKK
jgi:radical SAM protein with 4Fe4S-binding SPASM domain